MVDRGLGAALVVGHATRQVRASQPEKETGLVKAMRLETTRLVASVALASAAFGCGSAAPGPTRPVATEIAPDPATTVSSTATAPPPRRAPSPSAASSTPTILVDDPSRIETVPELAHFYRSLRALGAGSLGRNVRVLWLGDSHGQADFWSGRVRKALAERFGAAGPGFVHLGYKNYRHDGLKLEIRGKWRMRPKHPVGVKRDGDGVFGLGGLMMSGYADAPRAALVLSEPYPADKLSFDVCYRLKEPNDAVVIQGGDLAKTEIRATKAEPAGVVRHVSVQALASEPFVVDPIGHTDLCGVVVETDPATHPGVVLDTLAINGARYATALAWDEDAWVTEATRRTPDLVVLELGTNEAGDANPAYEGTARRVGELLARARRANPDVDCVVVSNTDRADAEDQTARMHDALQGAASKSGCMYFDAWQTLGGKGAMAKLREMPEPKVQKDGIHLTIKGYRELGAAMFDALMKGYAGKTASPEPKTPSPSSVPAAQGEESSTGTPMARATPSR